jgi:hypothetical protein
VRERQKRGGSQRGKPVDNFEDNPAEAGGRTGDFFMFFPKAVENSEDIL